MNIVAHEDDSLIFQNPDLIKAIEAGNCSMTVFLTAGDAGLPLTYTIDRENGAKAAYAYMAGKPNVWVESSAGIPGKAASMWTLSGTDIRLVFLRLPDGAVDGTGFGKGSIEQLWRGTVASLTTVDSAAAYTRGDLVSALVALMNSYQPSRINTQDFSGVFGGEDHSDHFATGFFAREASHAYTAEHQIFGYRGYATAHMPENVSEPWRSRKIDTFFTYTPFDPNACGQTPEQCAGIYMSWMSRQYVSVVASGGACAAQTGTQTLVSDTTNTVAPGTPAVAAYIPPTWTASIPGATWIWKSFMVADPTVIDETTFTKQFTLSGLATAGTITIAADDHFVATLNGVQFGSQNDFDNFKAGNESTYDITPLLRPGVNTLTITVRNIATVEADPTANPAGLLYRLVATTNGCAVTFFDTVQPATVSPVGGAHITTVYDGTPKTVSFTTDPAGLPLAITYGGSPTAPTNVGTYVVHATVTDGAYAGSSGEANLTITKVPQTITFAQPSDVMLATGVVGLSATSSAGLPVSFTASGACSMNGPASVRLRTIGTCTVVARQSGDANHQAAPNVTRSFAVRLSFVGASGNPPFSWWLARILSSRILENVPPTPTSTAPRDTQQNADN